MINKDIFELPDGEDMKVYAGDAPRAANVLSVQQGSLEYAIDFGVDIRFFVTSDYEIQNISFKTYLVERLLRHQINVVTVNDVVERLYSRYLMTIGTSGDNPGGFG